MWSSPGAQQLAFHASHQTLSEGPAGPKAFTAAGYQTVQAALCLPEAVSTPGN